MRFAAWLWWRPPGVLRTVLVHQRDPHAETLRGVLWRYRGRWFVLRRATLLADGASPLPLDGDIVIHRDNVAFLQVLPE